MAVGKARFLGGVARTKRALRWKSWKCWASQTSYRAEACKPCRLQPCCFTNWHLGGKAGPLRPEEATTTVAWRKAAGLAVDAASRSPPPRASPRGARPRRRGVRRARSGNLGWVFSGVEGERNLGNGGSLKVVRSKQCPLSRSPACVIPPPPPRRCTREILLHVWLKEIKQGPIRCFENLGFTCKTWAPAAHLPLSKDTFSPRFCRVLYQTLSSHGIGQRLRGFKNKTD